MKVRVSKVTTKYLRDELGVTAGDWYEVVARVGTCGADVKFPVQEHDEHYSTIILDGPCVHLYDNEQTEWEVSDA